MIQPITDVVQDVMVYQTTRPHDAHPALPVHLWRIHCTQVGAGRPIPTGRRDWVNSFATEELAQGQIPASHRAA